jgi:c-di-AMP phosphodiesterase-like protein
MLQNPNIMKFCKNIIIIDHHVESKDIIGNTMYKIIDNNSSSTSEIIVNFAQNMGIKFNSKIADIMLAGITIDTNNFTIKTSAATHEAAAILNNMGANSKYVQYLLKEDITDYINMQKIIFNTQIVDTMYAIATGLKTEIYEKEQLSKIADSLLTFDGVEASFCIGKINTNIIGISARSIGNINVQKIMEKLNGGGNKQDAACMMYNSNIEFAKEKLVNVLNGGNNESNIY